MRSLSGRAPTERQYRMLLSLGSGNAGLSYTKREAEPLLRRDWVTADLVNGYYQWVRITAAGLRALADGVDRYGLPEMRAGRHTVKTCSDCRGTTFGCRKCGGTSYFFDSQPVERAA